ncbi:MAG: hypothetical protein WBF03_06875 [Xanthobacteraceae bacterium]
MTQQGECSITLVLKEQSETGFDEMYVVLDGVRIAKRGRPDTPQAQTWVSLEPGFVVLDNSDRTAIIVEKSGVRLQ